MSKFKQFTKSYWVSAFNELKSLKILVIASLFIALRIVITSFYIPVSVLGTQKIFFSFLIVSIGGLIYGPIVGICTGVIADILGYLIHPQGAFFIGYTITSMVSGLVYGMFFYKTKVTILKLVLCKFCINIFVNVILNAYWDSFFIPNGYVAIVISRIPKNLVMLPIEVFLMYIVFKAMLPICKKEKLIDKDSYDGKIPLF